MHRLLRPKNINRAVVFFALLAPILYLFGTQFTALAGAHGEQVLADNSIQYDFEEISVASADDFQAGEHYKFVWNDSLGSFSDTGGTDYLFFYLGGYDIGIRYGFVTFGVGVPPSYLRYVYSGTYNANCASSAFVRGSVGWASDTVKTLYFVGVPTNISYSYWVANGTFYKRVEVPTSEVSQYRDALFGDMFGRSNFLSEWGENALSVDRVGFAPIGEFFAWIDDNLLHLRLLQVGLMGYGYAYYAAHVLIFDLLVYFATFFVRMIKDIVDRLEVSR